MDTTYKFVLDVEKQLSKSTPLEKDLTGTYDMFYLKKDQEIKENIKELVIEKEISSNEIIVEELNRETKPSMHKPKLNVLSPHLNYIFLEEGSRELVIIKKSLSTSQEKSLIQVLKGNKEVI